MTMVLRNEVHIEESLTALLERGGSCLERVTALAMSESDLMKKEEATPPYAVHLSVDESNVDVACRCAARKLDRSLSVCQVGDTDRFQVS